MKKHQWLAGLAASALLLTAVGCSPNANQKPDASAAPEQSKKDKIITIAYSDGGTTMDPAEASDLTSDTLVVAAYDQLVTYGVKTVDGGQVAKTDEIKPMLAKSWTVSDDKLTYTFKLQENAKFQSGNPVTADSVAFSLDHLKNSKAGSFLYQLSGIKAYTVKDAQTITIQLEKENHTFLQMLALYNFSVLDEKVIKEKGNDFLAKNAAGSGPFAIEKWDPASEAVMTANKNYWQGAPQVDKVTMKFLKEASNRVMLLGKGDVDLAIEIPPKDVADLKNNANLTVKSDASNRILYFALNTTKKPFDNVKVRQALAYAVPYDQLVHDVMYDQAKQLKSAVPSNTPGYSDSGFIYKHDLDKAKQLLKEAGYENGLSFDLTLGSGFQDWEDDAVLMQAEFAKIGVTMNIQKVARAQFLQMQRERNLTAYISKWTSFVNDPSYHLGFLLYGKGTSNYGNYKNAKVDELWEKANNEPDQAKRNEMYKQAQELITADAPWLYLYEYNRIVGMNKNLKGYVYYPDEILRFYPMSKGQ
ncbi:ABC transporter substrate-binding protein [Paenibacillus elgii]|uniref:ABC transporter substrate-binding protein n=1 Tax=Paenibacillus elgii TaxID=189691 RepID=UPI000FDAF8B2|nr:ABC transporter substrate-binding protein [Paenibacillus elgii]NEN85657.1 ABC transporter substrate-binding protein [Paenibacillus elgii]